MTFVLSEVIEIPNLALYHVTPKTEGHMRHLNKLRTSDSGVGITLIFRFIFFHLIQLNSEYLSVTVDDVHSWSWKCWRND